MVLLSDNGRKLGAIVFQNGSQWGLGPALREHNAAMGDYLLIVLDRTAPQSAGPHRRSIDRGSSFRGRKLTFSGVPEREGIGKKTRLRLPFRRPTRVSDHLSACCWALAITL